MSGADVLVVVSTFPDRETALRVAAELVECRLAACVNVQQACESMYRWEGKLEHATEVPVWIKTTRARYSLLESALRAAHPYELPEIIALPVTAGLAPYLDWVAAETTGGRPT